MPQFETERSVRGRTRVFARTQLPFVIACAVITAGAAIDDPAHLDSSALQFAWAITVVATVAALVVPWERLAAASMIVVVALDLCATALVHSELLGTIPAAGLLAVFPVLWLGYGFGTVGIVTAIAGTAFVTSFPYLRQWTSPATTREWVDVVALPLLVVLVAAMVHIAACQLQRSQRRSEEATARLRTAFGQAVDRSILVRSILDTVDAAVLYYDPDGRLVVSNRVADDFSRRLGALFNEVLASDVAHRVLPRALRGEEITDETLWLAVPGTRIAAEATSRQVRRRDGDVIGTVVIVRDVTELARSLEVREEFLKTVSHELRTPLTSITGYLDLIEESVAERDVATLQSHLAVVRRNTRRLSERIGELLAATEDTHELRLAEVDVAAMIDDVMRQARAEADARGITLEHLTASPATARIDRARLAEAVRELVANAVKFAPAHSAVTVAQRVVGDRLEVSVTDVGPGIAAVDQTRIFERFARTAHARQNAVQGFGLGLTRARDIVEAHGGTLHVDSRPGHGSRFTIDVPRAVAVEPRRLALTAV